MKSLIFLTLALTAVFFIMAQHNQPLTEKDYESIAVDAYIYAYPIVTMEITRQITTNSPTPTDYKAPMGQFFNAREFPDPEFKDVVAPNVDTFYSSAWLDLSKEPYVLHVPVEKNRYYLMSILDAWTNVVASLGTRTTGDYSQDFVITGPNWKGNIPSGLIEYKSPTNLVWIIGRTLAKNDPDDVRAVHNLQKEYIIKPLSFYGKDYFPQRSTINRLIDIRTPVRTQVDEMAPLVYFKLFTDLMRNNSPASEDSALLEKIAILGIVPGKEFDTHNLDPRILKALKNAPKLGQEKMAEYEKSAMPLVNGWLYLPDTGSYGTKYLKRAVVSQIELGADLPEDAVYGIAKVDSDGKLFNGRNQHVIHFAKGKVPPVNAFWSLTMYNTSFFLTENYLDRYSIGSKDPLKYNEDGSLDIYVQNASPGHAKETNWLPAPPDGFVLILRMYSPQEDVIKGSWKPPEVKRQK